MSAPRIEPPDHAPHVLVVDDDRRLRELLTRFLGENGYRVTNAGGAAEARAKSDSVLFDAIVLDVMMPGESGLDYLKSLGTDRRIPVLMLTARADPAHRIEGLEAGADDYLSKPFEPRELLLRLGNILKRGAGVPEAKPTGSVAFGPFSFRFDRGELRRGGEVIRITEREREILTLLGQKYGDVVPREDLAGSAGGGIGGDRAVDVQVNRLRRKIELDPANPTFLQTVRGVGYRLLVDP